MRVKETADLLVLPRPAESLQDGAALTESSLGFDSLVGLNQ